MLAALPEAALADIIKKINDEDPTPSQIGVLVAEGLGLEHFDVDPYPYTDGDGARLTYECALDHLHYEGTLTKEHIIAIAEELLAKA